MSDLLLPKQGKKKRKPKLKPISKLQRFARGQQCTLRLPNICNGNPETVVGAHVKPQGFGAMGAKPNDLHMVHACSDCHAFIDGGYAVQGWTREQVDSEIFRALCETQNRVIDEGIKELVA